MIAPPPAAEPSAVTQRALAPVFVVDAVALVLLAALTALVAVVGTSPHLDPLGVLASIAIYAAAWRIGFAFGAGSSTPLQLVFVPMWFVLPAATLPVVAIGGQLVANLASPRFDRDGDPQRGLLSSAADAWHAVVPMLGFAWLGHVDPTMGDAGLVLLIVVGQAVVWSVSSDLRRRAKGLWPGPARSLRGSAAGAMVDAALALLGLQVAIVLERSYWAAACVVPFMALLAHFSSEREHRMRDALELSAAYRGTAALMADVLEADDEYTGGEHTQDVVELSLRTGEVLGLDVAAMRTLEFGALLHDIGKLRVPNAVINKPGRLSTLEWRMIRRHPEIGEAMLLRVGGVLAEAAPVVRGHHERFDGGGYPDGLVGAAIPIEARIITVCDSFSAMTTNRSYRRAMTPHEAVAELHRCTPGQFDPAVVHALVSSLELDPGDGLRVAARVHRSFAEPEASGAAEGGQGDVGARGHSDVA